MSSFTKFDTDMSISYASRASKEQGRDLWAVNHAFQYYTGPENDRGWATVPQGFLTDGASIPRPLWLLLPPWGRYGQAAVLHDYLIEGGVISYESHTEKPTRAEADRIFLEAMAVLEVNLVTRYAMYAGVRAWAWVKQFLEQRKQQPS